MSGNRRRIWTRARWGRIVASAAALGLALPPADARGAGETSSNKQACVDAAHRGQTLRDEGRYREARDLLATCAATTCPPVVQEMCSRWLGAVNAAMPSIAVGARDANGRDLSDASVFLDGAPLVGALDGVPRPADPGAHTLRFEAPGYAPIEEHIVLRSGETSRVVVATFPPLAPPAVKEASAPAGEEGPRSPPAPDTSLEGPHLPAQTPESRAPRMILGLSLVVLTVASGSVGAYFVAKSSDDSRDAAALRAELSSPSACARGASTTCTQLSREVDSQSQDAWIGASSLVGAGLFALGSTLTWLLWRHPDGRAAAKTGWAVLPAFAPDGRRTLSVRVELW